MLVPSDVVIENLRDTFSQTKLFKLIKSFLIVFWFALIYQLSANRVNCIFSYSKNHNAT